MQVTFKYYNFEVLPIEQNATEIGSEGYKAIFDEYKRVVTSAHRDRILHTVSSIVSSDYLFIGSTILNRDDFSHGEFMRFHHSDSLVDIYNNTVEQEITPNLSAKIYKYMYSFDYTNHVIAIQELRLPTMNVFIRVLNDQFEAIVNRLYPDHLLSINELTSNESLEELLAADGYKRIKARVSFSNSDDSESELEQRLRRIGVGTSTLEESAAPGSFMQGITDHALAFLKLARRHGDAEGTILKDGRTKFYKMKNKPVKEAVKKLRDDSDESFIQNIRLSIINALSRTRSEDEN